MSGKMNSSNHKMSSTSLHTFSRSTPVVFIFTTKLDIVFSILKLNV